MGLLERICSNITTLISSLVISSSILMTYLFDQAVLLLGEIQCGSLLGLKGEKQLLGALDISIAGYQAYKCYAKTNVSLSPKVEVS